MMDNCREELFRVAQLYYVQDETMASIASEMGVSRSTVSRMLKTARETGIVRISLAPATTGASRVAQELFDEFGVHAEVVSVRASRPDHARLDAVAKVAAERLAAAVTPGTTVGVAWGTTLSAVATHVQPQPTPDVHIVQLNGAANSTTSGIPYAASIFTQLAGAFGADAMFFPVPAFFDFAETKEAMWRERSVQRVLAAQETCDVAVFGVGAISGRAGSHVYQAGYFDTPADRRALLTEGVVGDVCTVLMREDGSYEDIELNKRATGPTPAQLRRIPRRLCIVAGEAKAAPALAALRAQVATDLVIDERTARRVLSLARMSSTTG